MGELKNKHPLVLNNYLYNINIPNEEDICVLKEIIQSKLYLFIKNKFVTTAIDFFSEELFNKKKDTKRTLENIFSSWFFYINAIIKDKKYSLLPSLNKDTCSYIIIKNIFNDYLRKTILNPIARETIIEDFLIKVDLLKLFNRSICVLDKLLTSDYYILNKDKVNISMTRDNKIIYFNIITDVPNILLPFKIRIAKETFAKIKNKLIKPISDKTLSKLVFILLMKYETINSGNHQLAVPKEFMNTFEELDIQVECFASFFNSGTKSYFSLFPEEGYFGSCGSFFNSTIIEGEYSVNPPYQLHLINLAIIKILGFLQAAKKNGRKLKFFLTLPNWVNNNDYEEFTILEEIKNSSFLQEMKVLKNNEFYYIDYLKNKTKDITLPDTIIIILST